MKERRSAKQEQLRRRKAALAKLQAGQKPTNDDHQQVQLWDLFKIPALRQGVVLVLCLFAGWGLLAWLAGGERLGQGTFGDAFGALTGLVTALGLLAAVYGIYQQRLALEQQQRDATQARQEFAEQLKAARGATEMQREELVLARTQYERQAEAAEKAAEVARAQTEATRVLSREIVAAAFAANVYSDDTARQWLMHRRRALPVMEEYDLLMQLYPGLFLQLPAATREAVEARFHYLRMAIEPHDPVDVVQLANTLAVCEREVNAWRVAADSQRELHSIDLTLVTRRQLAGSLCGPSFDCTLRVPD